MAKKNSKKKPSKGPAFAGANRTGGDAPSSSNKRLPRVSLPVSALGVSGLSGGGQKVVPRDRVGVLVQAVVSGENATSVSAIATDAAAKQFRIEWS